MFIVGCQDQSTSVSVAAMAATAAYINALADQPEVMQLQCVLTPMLGVMHACLQRGRERTLLCHFVLRESEELTIVLHLFSSFMLNMISQGDEEIVVDALDVLQDCVEMEQPLVNDHIEVRLHSWTGMTS